MSAIVALSILTIGVGSALLLYCVSVATHSLIERYRRSERSRQGLQPEPPAPTDEDSRTAIHEAGHVVAAWYCHSVEDVTSAYINEDGGRVKYATHGDVAAVWCQATVALAGIAAEARVYKRWRSGEMRSDLARARTLVGAVAGEPPPWPETETPVLPFETAYEPALTPEEARSVRRAYAMARRVVAAHEARLYRVAGLLLHRRTIGSADLALALGSRAFIRTLAAFGRRGFWTP